MGKHVILIGFMGAGKTTVGKVLADTMERPLWDTDLLIEEKAGMSISRIFERYGEEEFRRLETETVRTLTSLTEERVVAVGGGLPLREENRRLLRQAGIVVYLRVRPETVLIRLAGDTTRPLLQGENVEEKVEKLLAYRSPIYEEAAHLVLDVDGKSPGRIGKEILCKKRLKIWDR